MPEPVKVVTTIALKAVLQQLEAEFSQATGRGIAMAFGPPSRAVRMVLDGETADIVMTTPEGMEELTAAGLVAAETRRVVLRMIMGVAVRAGAPKPDISTVEGFKRAMRAARSVTYANPALGSPSAQHFLKVAEKLGIAEAVKAKALVSEGLVARHVAAGEAELAVQQLSELLLVEGVEIAGPFPAEIQNVVPLAAAVHARAAAPQAAAVLLDLIASPRAKAVIEKAGLRPA
ncbi:MAG TPA: substrate-binding domain-containing protein [Xanthobacteraceae bacterium]|nr:substrate-binding domain-containing protein [Xanthobacteraceae bacterium]